MKASPNIRAKNLSSRAAKQKRELTCDIAAPDGTLVAVVGAQSLAAVGVPHVGLVVLGARKQKVALDKKKTSFRAVRAKAIHA